MKRQEEWLAQRNVYIIQVALLKMFSNSESECVFALGSSKLGIMENSEKMILENKRGLSHNIQKVIIASYVLGKRG